MIMRTQRFVHTQSRLAARRSDTKRFFYFIIFLFVPLPICQGNRAGWECEGEAANQNRGRTSIKETAKKNENEQKASESEERETAEAQDPASAANATSPASAASPSPTNPASTASAAAQPAPQSNSKAQPTQQTQPMQSS